MKAKPLDIALLLLLATLWGGSFTFIKVGVETIPPLTLIAGRTSIAALLLVAILCYRGVALPTDAAVWRQFLVQACLNSVFPFTLIAWAEQTVDAGLATILNSTSPIFTFILTWILAGRHHATARRLFGVVSGMIGTCLIVGVEALTGLRDQLIPELAIVAATICYAGAALFSRKFERFDPMLPAAGSLLSGAIVLVPLCLVVDQPWTLEPSSRSIAALIGLSVFSTALAFTIYFRLIRTLGPVGTTSQAYLRVPIGIAIGVLFLGESLAPTTWVGSILVIVGVAAMTLPAKKR